MHLWTLIEFAAWAVSAVLALYLVFDWLKTDASYPEELLTSSREGEVELMAEQHKLREERRG